MVCHRFSTYERVVLLPSSFPPQAARPTSGRELGSEVDRRDRLADAALVVHNRNRFHFVLLFCNTH